jgi:hypothetical protein
MKAATHGRLIIIPCMLRETRFDENGRAEESCDRKTCTEFIAKVAVNAVETKCAPEGRNQNIVEVCRSFA